MSTLSSQTLRRRHDEFIDYPRPFMHCGPRLVNPASIDIRLGDHLRVAYRQHWYRKVLCALTFGLFFRPRVGFYDVYINNKDYYLKPGDFVLASTYEKFHVPNDVVMDIRLKSSRAREGYEHSLALWFDPGWDGVGTLELHSLVDWPLPLSYGMKIAQTAYHALDEPCDQPYNGRYQGAQDVESAKPDAKGKDHVH